MSKRVETGFLWQKALNRLGLTPYVPFDTGWIYIRRFFLVNMSIVFIMIMLM